MIETSLYFIYGGFFGGGLAFLICVHVFNKEIKAYRRKVKYLQDIIDERKIEQTPVKRPTFKEIVWEIENEPLEELREVDKIEKEY